MVGFGIVDAKSVTVVDVRTEEAIRRITFDTAVLTGEVDSGPDGSTARIFVIRRLLHVIRRCGFWKAKRSH